MTKTRKCFKPAVGSLNRTHFVRNRFNLFIYNKLRVFFQKLIDNAFVFFGFGAADGIYENAGRFHQPGQVLEEGLLFFDQYHKVFLGNTPFDVRVASHDP